MRFDLINYQDSSTTVVELDEHLRMPLTAYKSARFCLIQDLIEMSNLNWKIILDEAFRSIHSDGEVEFEIREFSRYDLRNLFIFLGAAANNRECELIRYARVKGNHHQIKLKVLRVHPIDSAWSICYISDGENLKQIVDVGERFLGHSNIEILVCGPKSKLIELPKNITVIDDSGLPRPAMISLKKNRLIEKAKNDNLLILHDRYSVGNEFFEAFKKFGFDYGVAVPKQTYGKGPTEYPGLLAEHSGKVFAVTEHVVRDDFFINGGCLAIKRTLAYKTPLNSFLAWGEMEDIDWTSRLIRQGEVPRLVREATIQTVGTDLKKTSSIIDHQFVPERVSLQSELDCLLAAPPKIFFQQLPLLLENYPFRDNFIKRLRAICNAFSAELDSSRQIHMTPLRFNLSLNLSFLLRLSPNPQEISRVLAFQATLKCILEIFQQSKSSSLCIIPVAIYRCLSIFSERKFD